MESEVAEEALPRMYHFHFGTVKLDVTPLADSRLRYFFGAVGGGRVLFPLNKIFRNHHFSWDEHSHSFFRDFEAGSEKPPLEVRLASIALRKAQRVSDRNQRKREQANRRAADKERQQRALPAAAAGDSADSPIVIAASSDTPAPRIAFGSAPEGELEDDEQERTLRVDVFRGLKRPAVDDAPQEPKRTRHVQEQQASSQEDAALKEALALSAREHVDHLCRLKAIEEEERALLLKLQNLQGEKITTNAKLLQQALQEKKPPTASAAATTKECKICFEEVASLWACVPCGHAFVCHSCVPSILPKGECAICRTRFVLIIPIFE